MDRTDGNDINDRMRAASGQDLGGTPHRDATSESLVGDTLRTGAAHTGHAADRVADGLTGGDERRADVNPGDEVGEAVGGISGVLTGAALGSLGGPVGTIIGGIAGAVSGWWAGRAISEAASHATDDDDTVYREHYTSAARADRQYDDVRPAYQLGHIASRNPDYQGRRFDDIETDLRHGWSGDVSQRHGSWDEVRDYARHAYERNRTGGAHAGMGGTGEATGSHVGSALTGGALGAAGGMAAAGDRMDHTLDRVGDRTEHAAHRAGNAIEHAADRTGNALENAWDKTKDAVRHAGEKVADAVDDTKDRIDGDPASRPGIDRTDRTDRVL